MAQHGSQGRREGPWSGCAGCGGEELLCTGHTLGLGFWEEDRVGGALCAEWQALLAGPTETLRAVGQPSSSMGPWSGSSREYSTEKVTGFT